LVKESDFEWIEEPFPPLGADEVYRDLAKLASEGKVHCRVDVVDGLDKAPNAVNKLFDGSNRGKLIVEVSEEPSLKSG
jgi:NADPH-dependent curcumin reductase CurA